MCVQNIVHVEINNYLCIRKVNDQIHISMNNLTEEFKTSLAIQFVVMDAMQNGHTNPDELIQFMKTKTFETAVKGYLSLMQTSLTEINNQQ